MKRRPGSSLMGWVRQMPLIELWLSIIGKDLRLETINYHSRLLEASQLLKYSDTIYLLACFACVCMWYYLKSRGGMTDGLSFCWVMRLPAETLSQADVSTLCSLSLHAETNHQTHFIYPKLRRHHQLSCTLFTTRLDKKSIWPIWCKNSLSHKKNH